MIEVIINRKTHRVDVEPDTPLLWVIRDTLNLTGTKYGCGIQQCGACTVLIKERPVRSCGVTIEEVAGNEIINVTSFELKTNLERPSPRRNRENNLSRPGR